MTTFEIASIFIALGVFLTGIGTIFIAIKTNKLNDSISSRQLETDKNIAKRQGIFDLHNAWKDLNDIDLENYITPDIVAAINALSLTASLWNHDVLEKEVIYQSYWQAFKGFYEKIEKMNKLLPGCDYSPDSKLSNDIIMAYKEMSQKIYFKSESTKL